MTDEKDGLRSGDASPKDIHASLREQALAWINDNDDDSERTGHDRIASLKRVLLEAYDAGRVERQRSEAAPPWFRDMRCPECGEMMASHIVKTRHATGTCEECFHGPELVTAEDPPRCLNCPCPVGFHDSTGRCTTPKCGCEVLKNSNPSWRMSSPSEDVSEERRIEERLVVTDLCDMHAFNRDGRLGQVLRRAINFIEGYDCFPGQTSSPWYAARARDAALRGERARLDADGTAKPKTEILAVMPESAIGEEGKTVHLGQAAHYIARPTIEPIRLDNGEVGLVDTGLAYENAHPNCGERDADRRFVCTRAVDHEGDHYGWGAPGDPPFIVWPRAARNACAAWAWDEVAGNTSHATDGEVTLAVWQWKPSPSRGEQWRWEVFVPADADDPHTVGYHDTKAAAKRCAERAAEEMRTKVTPSSGPARTFTVDRNKLRRLLCGALATDYENHQKPWRDIGEEMLREVNAAGQEGA